VVACGDKSKYTEKQKRQAEHIEEGYEERGVSEDEAERRAWATVNKMTGGGKKSGSGRGQPFYAANFGNFTLFPGRRRGRTGSARGLINPSQREQESVWHAHALDLDRVAAKSLAADREAWLFFAALSGPDKDLVDFPVRWGATARFAFFN
jgi:plasmid stabilization system protein ParE